MSSERSRERLHSGDGAATDGGQPARTRSVRAAPPPSPMPLSLSGSIAERPISRSTRWQPQNWRLRTKLLALTVVPLVLAVVLGVIRVVDTARHSHSSAVSQAIVIGVIALVALILLVFLARSILKPLRVLRASAFDVADRRLPTAIELLRTTDGRSGGIRVDPVPVYSREDVGQVARAFDAVHSEAVRLATEQAALRANVNDMFVNLSRRSQSLVERQLRLIDELERGEQDADRLAYLFRLDHLATRMRRNGENLLVLAGAELRQRSGEPVALLDVLRASVSEIEDYQRVTIQPEPRAMVSGLAVNDIVHLVAELLDNATTYSDPESNVTLSARLTDDGGLVIEICDEGTGIPRARLVEINQRLAAPPPVDVSVSRQMGLFVVGRLASRHGLTVQLASPDGSGVTVTVTLPRELIISGTSWLPGSEESVAEPLPVRSAPLPALDARPRSPSYASPETWENHQPAYGRAAPPRHGFLDDPSETTGAEFETPIFAAMLSKWFTERHVAPAAAPDVVYAAPEQASTPPNGPPNGWESDADAGWQAAAAASDSGPDEVTPAGLPKRRPGALLVPGSVSSDTSSPQLAASAVRSAEAIRGRMSSYQEGLTRGRHSQSASHPDEALAASNLGRHTWQLNGGEPPWAGHDDHNQQMPEDHT
jgi:signal transduction histidine kinase